MPSAFPLFPLGAVIVPGLVLPLHIFEPRYRALVEELLAIPDEEAREFGVVAVRDGREVEREGIDALFPVGTSVVLRQAERLPDGRFDIVTTGLRRFRVRAIDTSAPLVRADVDFLEDVSEPADELAAAEVGRRFLAYRAALMGQVGEGEDAPDPAAIEALPDDPVILSFLVTAAMVLPAQERQDLLACARIADRLALARTLLRREVALLGALGAVPAIELPGPAPSAN